VQTEFDQASGRLTFSHAGLGEVCIQSAQAWARYVLGDGKSRDQPLLPDGASVRENPITDVHGDGVEWVLRCPANPDGIQLTYLVRRYQLRPFLLLRLSLENQGREPISLHNLCLFQASPSNAGRVILKAPIDGYHFLKIGWHGWDDSSLRGAHEYNSRSWLNGLTKLFYSNPATDKPASPGEFSGEGWGLLIGAEVAVLAGLASTDHQFGQVYASLRPGYAALMLVTQVDGIRIDPGEMCDSEWGYLQFMAIPSRQPEADFVEAVARQMRARLPAIPPPPMWTHWYQFYHNIREQTILEKLDLLAEVRKIVPYRMIELDDGYQAAWGDWTSTNSRFPHGLAWLAKEIRLRGFIPGLWLAPFVVQNKSRLASDHPDWLVKNEKGKPSKAGFLYNRFIHALDLTHPAVLEHLQQLAHTLTHTWGFGMLKLDYLNAGALPGRRYNPKLTRAEALRLGLDAIRLGAGTQTFLLGCGCPFGPAIGEVDAMRIGPDTAASWEPYIHWLPWARPLIRNNPSLPALRNALRNTLVLSSLQRKWWWNDPDCLLVRNHATRLTEPEVQSAVSLVGLSGGMLVHSDDLHKVSPGRLEWISLLTPDLGLSGAPLDLLKKEMPGLYQVKVEHAGQSWQLVALFNWMDHPGDCRLRLADLGYPEGMQLHVFDFWERQYLHVTQPEMVFAHVPAHGCKLLRICQAVKAPQLVGDTLHISQGVELSYMRVVDRKIELETIDLGRRVRGELWLALGKFPGEAHCNGERVKMEDQGQGIFAVEVHNNDGKLILEVGL
jgi:alpha-galactosidase